MANISTTNISVTSPRKYPNRRIPRSNSVSSGLSFSRSDTLPNSVFFAVKMTNTFAVPLTTCVPIQTVFVRCASAVSTGNTSTDFSTGKVSPVSMASSTNISFDSSIKQSPGTISPAFSKTISPGTISSI